MADSSITRMNLSAIKKVDPYAKDIVDSSSHVAFYTFNSEQNEWEKTDVEGAFFIYNRNAEPFHSIFINNRLNTTSFVEPITGQLELQSQPPFLLYRNERSRIRGFWFYNSEECDRISHLVTLILQKKGNGLISQDLIINSSNSKSQNTNIFNMLSKAQQDYNLQKAVDPHRKSTPSNVLQFFESAKQSSSEPIFKRVLPLSVDQIEKLQQVSSPSETLNNTMSSELRLSPKTKPNPSGTSEVLTTFPPLGECQSFSRMGMQAPSASDLSVKDCESELCLRRLFFGQLRSKPEGNEEPKPALMPPTMFDNSGIKQDSSVLNISSNRQRINPQQPLDSTQFLQALTYLMHNDKEFVKKLHDAYLKSFSKLVFDNNATYQ